MSQVNRSRIQIEQPVPLKDIQPLDEFTINT